MCVFGFFNSSTPCREALLMFSTAAKEGRLPAAVLDWCIPFQFPMFFLLTLSSPQLSQLLLAKSFQTCTSPWPSENIDVAQDPENHQGICTSRKGSSVPDNTKSKIFSLQKPQEGVHPAQGTARVTTVMSRRNISFKAAAAPARLVLQNLLHTTPLLLPYLLCKPSGNLHFSLKDFNLWDKQSFTQADKSCLVSGETM